MYKDLLSKKFGIYFTRWQISAWVMLPVMLVLESFLPLWLNLMIGQAVGALIFWEIDKYIFHNHKTDNVEDALSKDKNLHPDVSSRKL
jgi:hypothetical protein